jgi:hypothetical protein
MTRDAFRLRWCPDHTLTHDDADRDGEALFMADLDALLAATRAEALRDAIDEVKALVRANQRQSDEHQEAGRHQSASNLILWGGGIVEALVAIRALVKP